MASIGPGMLVLLGVLRDDGPEQAARLARRVAGLRFFADEDGRMNLAATDVGASALVVSQVTLASDTRRGRRPSLDTAAPPRRADELYQRFAESLRETPISVSTGVFGARMEVELVNDGPVTFVLEESG